MNFFDFFHKFWWIEALAIGAIIYGWYTDYFAMGTAFLVFIGSVLLFFMLSKSGLE